MTDLATKELIDSNVLQGEVLEVKCKKGERAFYLYKTLHKKITGIDNSASDIDYAIVTYESPVLQFYQSNLSNFTFSRNLFDSAYLITSALEIENLEDMIKEICRVVRQKGKIFLSISDFTGDIFNFLPKKVNIIKSYVKEDIIFVILEV